jgi:hypothetical protein
MSSRRALRTASLVMIASLAVVRPAASLERAPDAIDRLASALRDQLERALARDATIRMRALAVAPVLVNDDPHLRALQAALTQRAQTALFAALARSNGIELKLVERDQLDKVIRELGLTLNDGSRAFFDSRTAVRVGQFVQANAVLLMLVQSVGASFYVNMKIVTTEEAFLVATVDATVSEADLFPPGALGKPPAAPVAAIDTARAGVIDTAREPGTIPPHPITPLHVIFAASYAFTWLNAHLPVALQSHENNLEDVIKFPFLSGFPGLTPIERAFLQTVEVEGGAIYYPRDGHLGVVAEYVAHVPTRWNSRFQTKQINDPRPATMGSFIYSDITERSVGQAFRTGISWRATESSALEWQGLIDVGRWDMTFQAGRQRFGNDEPELTASAVGHEYSPRLRLSIARQPITVQITAGLTIISFGYDSSLESHRAVGFSLSGGISKQLRLHGTAK